MRNLQKVLISIALTLGLSAPVLADPGPSSIRVDSQRHHYSGGAKYDSRYDRGHRHERRYRKEYRDYHPGNRGYHRGHDKHWKHHAKRHHGKKYYRHDHGYRDHGYGHGRPYVYTLPRGSTALILGGNLYHRWRDQYYLSGYHNGDKVFFAIDLKL